MISCKKFLGTAGQKVIIVKVKLNFIHIFDLWIKRTSHFPRNPDVHLKDLPYHRTFIILFSYLLVTSDPLFHHAVT